MHRLPVRQLELTVTIEPARQIRLRDPDRHGAIGRDRRHGVDRVFLVLVHREADRQPIRNQRAVETGIDVSARIGGLVVGERVLLIQIMILVYDVVEQNDYMLFLIVHHLYSNETLFYLNLLGCQEA